MTTDRKKEWDAGDLVADLDAIMTEQATHNRYVARVHDYLRRQISHLPLFRLGLTGGFATGKSTVAHCFEELGCPVVSADTIVHDLLAHDATIQQDIRFAFGDDVFCHPSLREGSQIDRSKLAARIFAGIEDRKTLEAILHPRVGDVMKREAERLEAEGHTIACFEIPLLVESGWQDWCDSVVVVACDDATQITRAMSKFGMSRDEALSRIHAQLPLEDKKKRADVVIDNTGPQENLKPQVEAIYNRLLPQS